jgi:hypothetical protein
MAFAALSLGECGNWGGPGSEALVTPPPLDDGPSGGNVADSYAFYDATHDGGLFDDSFASASHQSVLCTGTAGEDKTTNQDGTVGCGDGQPKGLRASSTFTATSNEPAAICDMLGNVEEQTIPCNDDAPCHSVSNRA